MFTIERSQSREQEGAEKAGRSRTRQGGGTEGEGGGDGRRLMAGMEATEYKKEASELWKNR